MTPVPIEDATEFNATKFLTTFQAIVRYDVPPSHALVFHFTSQRIADVATRTGIPSTSTAGGVPFSLRGPHDLTPEHKEVLRRVMPAMEVVLCCALPKELLLPAAVCAGSSDASCLRVVSDETLRAMHPTDFDCLKVRRPWENGYLLLSPVCIKRAYLYQQPKVAAPPSGGKHSAMQASTGEDLPLEFHGVSAIDPIEAQVLSQSAAALAPRDASRSAHAGKGSTSGAPRRTSALLWGFPRSSSSATASQPLDRDSSLSTGSGSSAPTLAITSIQQYLEVMAQVRETCSQLGLVPLYHYTNKGVEKYILRGETGHGYGLPQGEGTAQCVPNMTLSLSVLSPIRRRLPHELRGSGTAPNAWIPTLECRLPRNAPSLCPLWTG